MQTVNSFITGVFQRELKNRFLCEVLIDGKTTLCYVPSSCHLSNFLRLEGKTVLLVPTASRSRTKFALFAVRYRNSHILLNSSIANRVIEANLRSRRFYFLGKRKNVIKEHTVYDYKTDLYLPDTDTIIEIKSIISTDRQAAFPSVYSERALKQLIYIQELLKQGHKVYYLIVSLSPAVQEITVDKNSMFYQEFFKCVELGMLVHGYSCRLHDNKLVITKELSLIY